MRQSLYRLGNSWQDHKTKSPVLQEKSLELERIYGEGSPKSMGLLQSICKLKMGCEEWTNMISLDLFVKQG